MHDGWHGAPRFPRPLHHGRQEVLGTDCEVLVMQVPRAAPRCPALPRAAPLTAPLTAPGARVV
jgi:hypothetical protein